LAPAKFEIPNPNEVCRWVKTLASSGNLQIRNPKRVQGYFPAEGLGVSPNFLLYTPKSGGQGVDANGLGVC